MSNAGKSFTNQRGRVTVPGRFVHFCALSAAVGSLLGGRAPALDRGCIGHQHKVVPFDGADSFEQGQVHFIAIGPQWLKPRTFRVPASSYACKDRGQRAVLCLPPRRTAQRIFAASLPGNSSSATACIRELSIIFKVESPVASDVKAAIGLLQ